MLKLSGHGGVCEHDICARWIVANSGIFPDIGNYVTRQYIGAWQQFFRTFQGKRQQGGKFIKCAEVRTKKGMPQMWNVAKSGTKKER